LQQLLLNVLLQGLVLEGKVHGRQHGSLFAGAHFGQFTQGLHGLVGFDHGFEQGGFLPIGAA